VDLNLFKNINVNKTNILTVGGYTFTVADLIGGITYNQTVNSGVDVILGSCTVATIEFQLNNMNQLINSLAGQEITWKIKVETSPGVFEDIPMGIFIAEKPTKINDTAIRIKAYDRMIKFDTIIDDWLATVVYPITLKNLLTGLCSYIGVPIATTAFLNESFVVKKNFNGINVKGRDFLKWICEIAAKYAIINELGQLKLGWYTSIIYGVTNADYYSIKIEDYQTKKIDKLQVRVEENDIGVIVGIGTNAYIIENNPLLYAETDAEIRPTIEAIYNAIKDFTYTPFEITLNANPLIKTGNTFTVTTRKGQVINVVVMTRKMTNGTDVYSATGNLDRSISKSINQSILQIRGKTNVLERTIDATISKLYDADTGDLTVLTQTVTSFNSRVQSIEANMSFTHKGDTAPLNPAIGDTWFSTSNQVFIVDNLLMTVDNMLQTVDYYSASLNKTYRWNGSDWQHIEDGAITELRLNVSEISQTVDLISLSVASYDGRMATLELTATSLTSRVLTTEGDVSTLEQTATALTSRILTAEGNISTVTQTATSLTSRISTAEGNVSTISQSVSSITSRISTAEGNISTVTQTATSLASRISTAEGNISTVTQTATSLTSRLTTAEGNVSTVTQTANSLTSRISTAEGNISTVTQTTSGITAAVNNSKLTFDTAGLTIKNGGFKIMNGSYESLSIKSTGGISMSNGLECRNPSLGTVLLVEPGLMKVSILGIRVTWGFVSGTKCLIEY